jgi:hypothetical protein
MPLAKKVSTVKKIKRTAARKVPRKIIANSEPK